MELSSDPYEQRLFELFKSHQGKNSVGLDKDGLLKLCASLELKNRSEALINLLITKNSGKKSDDGKWIVSFQDFRAALLQILGAEMGKAEDHTMSSSISSSPSKTLTNHPSLDNTTTTTSHLNPDVSEPEMSDREIKPKFIVGTKKYGRRSRPTNDNGSETLTDSDDEEDDDDETYCGSPSKDANIEANKRNKVQRSASQSDMHGTKRRRPMSASRLKRCASLPPHRGNIVRNRFMKSRTATGTNQAEIDVDNLTVNLQEIWNSFGKDSHGKLTCNQLEAVCEKLGLHKLGAKQAAHEAFEKLSIAPNAFITYQQFLNLIQNDSNVLSSRENSMDTLAAINSTMDSEHCLSAITKEAGSVQSDIIVDMWESAGVVSASALLVGLGFYGNEIQISELINTLEEEISRSTNEKETAPLLKASLTLHRAEVGALRQAFKQLIDENKKLYSNNKEMNNRAAILAQEVDERHSNIEKATKKEIQALEGRHAEAIRALTEQLSAERDQYLTLNSRLETKIKSLESEESKLKAELSSLLEENSALESEKCDLHNQITDLYEQNIKLNKEIAELEDLKSMELRKEKENEEMLELIDKVSSLQIENSNLRDKNDELTAEIEGMSIEINKLKARRMLNRGGFLNETVVEPFDEEITTTAEQELINNGAVKRRGDSPSKIRLSEESPRQGKLRKCNNDGNESETSGDWMTLNSELNQSMTNATGTTSGFSQDSSISDSEIKSLKEKISELQKELQNRDNAPKDENGWRAETDKLKSRCKDLEASLEQMRKEYEDCEDYWQAKLADERLLYEEEQRQSDDKLTELLRKMSEYEEQFASACEKSGKLSPIEENSMLEQQYVALEAEMEELVEKARNAIEEKEKEIEELKVKVASLESRSSEYRPPTPRADTPDSPASSTINYLFWNQSSIHGPARDYQNPVYNQNTDTLQTRGISFKEEEEAQIKKKSISPIQKPSKSSGDECDGASTKSVATTHSVHHSTRSVSPIDQNAIRLSEKNLKEEIQMLIHQRDCLITELQQLQEAKPILAQAYTRTPHPNLSNRIQYLEQKNKHLQAVLKQQQQYMESVMHQAWQQQRLEIVELRNRLEAQSVVITEQAQRLANADLLAKDLFVENSHLTATIQRLEQQRTRQALLQLSQHLPHLQQQGIGGLP